MASKNTVSRDKLTPQDERVFLICEKLLGILLDGIPVQENKEAFKKDYGRLHRSRDAGQGRGAGKLQRDALTTRGRQGKAPFSNRNLRWHPLVVSYHCDQNNFKEIKEIRINEGRILSFKTENGFVLPKDVYKLETPYCISYDKWEPLIGEIKNWTEQDWINNWCTIPAAEYSTRQDSIESYAVLGLSIAVNFYGASLENTYGNLERYLNSVYPDEVHLPSCESSLLSCPLCLVPVSQYPAGLNRRERPHIWKPSWQSSKRGEGEDESIQLTHVFPLEEGTIYHTAEFTRYGHRWCNVAMTDHSVPQTLDFMSAIIKKYKEK